MGPRSGSLESVQGTAATVEVDCSDPATGQGALGIAPMPT